MNKWDASKIPSLEGKIIVVTGANSGLGFECVKELLKHNAKVIFACRNEEKATNAIYSIKKDYPEADAIFMKIDLDDLDSVKSFAEKAKESLPKIDVLINNAGLMALPEREETKQGFERQIGVNYLAHFHLTSLLLPLLEKSPDGRVVTVSSIAHRWGKMDLDDLMAESPYKPFRSYSESKLACLMFAYELDRRLKEHNMKTIAVSSHPGWSDTPLSQNSKKGFRAIFSLGQPAWKGALSILYAATAEEVERGSYYGPRAMGGAFGYPKKNKSSKLSRNEELQKALFDKSVELTNSIFFEDK